MSRLARMILVGATLLGFSGCYVEERRGPRWHHHRGCYGYGCRW